MSKTRTMYMHTLDGQPARFSELWRIVHRVPRRSRLNAVSLVATVDEIKAQQAQSRRRLKSEGYAQGTLSYVRVEVPV